MPQDLHPEALRLGETEYHLHLFIVDFLLFDYACANPGEYVCD
jgi:hypothetical protein